MAASFVPPDDEVILPHSWVVPTDVSSVQVAPESVDVQMLPSLTAAASCMPSADEVIERQSLPAPVDVFSVQVAPESADVQMLPSLSMGPALAHKVPSLTATASFVPSADETMSDQLLE